MNSRTEQQFKAIASALEALERRVAQHGIGPAERTKLQADLTAVGRQLREQEDRLQTARTVVGPDLKCPESGETMGTCRILNSDAAISDDGLWFSPGALPRLLATFEERTGRSPTTSLEQVILELDAEQAKQRARSGLHRLSDRLNAVRKALAEARETPAGDPHLAAITDEVAELKKQAANMDLAAGQVAQPNITPHPGALVSLVRDGEQPCYLYAHEGSKAWLGRGSKCSVRIKDKRISRLHCVIISAGNNWYVADLGSRNGTYVNGVRIEEPVRLSHNDTVNLGGGASLNFSVIAIAVNEEEFYTLALKEITGQATDDDREELEDLLEQKAELRAEYDQLRHGSVIARDALPLVNALDATEGTLSEAGIARLDSHVTKTFSVRREDIEQQLAASSRVSPQTGGRLTRVQVGEAELEADLSPGRNRGGIFVRRDQFQALLRQPQAGEQLREAIELAEA